jgi:hypothetical protein
MTGVIRKEKRRTTSSICGTFLEINWKYKIMPVENILKNVRTSQEQWQLIHLVMFSYF